MAAATVLKVVKSPKAQIIAGTAVGVGIAIAAAPLAVGAMGFTGAGIAANSVAAWLMSLYAGATPAAGIVAALQSAGATGAVLSSPGIVTAAGGAGGVVGAAGAATARGVVAATKYVKGKLNKRKN